MPKPKPESTHPNAAAFPSGLSGPALRALAAAGIRSLAALSRYRESDVRAMHGMGPSALRSLRTALREAGRDFRGA